MTVHPNSVSSPAPTPSLSLLSAQRVAGTPQVRVEIRSNPLYLSGVRELVSGIAKRLGFTDESCGQIALAVDEALCNVIRHGYQRETNRPIWLSIWPVGGIWGPSIDAAATTQIADQRADAMLIVIEDEAAQVDPETIRSRDLEQIRPGGLGVHIIKTVMDEAVYEKRSNGSGAGMRLSMLKRRVEDDKHSASGPAKGSSDCCGGKTNCGSGSEESHHG